MTSRHRIEHGDSREVLPRFKEGVFDAVITDPPYELGFMAKKWDSSGISFDPEFWRLCYRVLKPGGHLLAFGGSRTFHRIAVAIEDAGFELRDTLMWLYGSGFPKSLDVSKAIDKRFGAKRERVGWKRSSLDAATVSVGGFTALPENAPDPETGLLPVTAPATPEAEQWMGWGTALKPAFEPILMFRKPLEGTVAQNVLKYGIGGINIDGARMPTSELRSGVHVRSAGEVFSAETSGLMGEFVYDGSKGRWPANVVLGCACDGEHDEDCPVRMLDGQAGRHPTPHYNRGQHTRGGAFNSGSKPAGQEVGYADGSGSVSRFFYCAKAGRAERELGLLDLPPQLSAAVEHHGEGSKGLQSPSAGTGRGSITVRNNHPTVKPLALMQWLVRLVTPPDGIILDPFAGSGTTIVAAKIEGFSGVGIEQDDRYIQIARKALAVPLLKRQIKLAAAARLERQEARLREGVENRYEGALFD